ncbi:MAG: glycosyltransferase [Burkholderiaceae bacterium]|jgi:glycosyltransferase involved in cell wall biosynthesis|nr:glycosyltransferase [Burkholderiaceae bacterium]
MSSDHLVLLGDAASVHMQRWAREMRARGWRVSLVTARPAPKTLEALHGVRQVTLPPAECSCDWLWRAGAARRALQRLQPGIVHAHYVTSYGYLAARASGWLRRAGVPVVMSAWGSDLLVTPRESALKRLLTAWTLRRADAVTGASPDLLAAARAFAPGVRTALIHWGVERERFAPAPWADKPGFEAVSLRSWEANYRIDTILDGLALLRARQPDRAWRLHLLGGGSLEAALRAQTARLGLQGAVQFHGRLDDAGMAAVLARCKLSISVPVSDATSVSVLESMACGLPVIASDLPANRDWLDPALLVPAGDAAALARRWQTLADDDAHAWRIGAANAGRIAREGGRKAQMDAVDRLYRDLLAGRRGARS